MADVGDADPFGGQKEVRVVPASTLLADKVLGRNDDVVKEDLAHLVLAVQQADRTHGDPGVCMSTRKKEIPS